MLDGCNHMCIVRTILPPIDAIIEFAKQYQATGMLRYKSETGGYVLYTERICENFFYYESSY